MSRLLTTVLRTTRTSNGTLLVLAPGSSALSSGKMKVFSFRRSLYFTLHTLAKRFTRLT